MRVLGIESTCDETAAAVVEDGVRVLSNVIASQAEIHAKYRGVVPEIASRAHIENIMPVIREALAGASFDWSDIDAIAVAHRPGLIGSLLIGVTAAKTLAWMMGKPLIGVDHVHAHLYSVELACRVPSAECRMEGKEAPPSPYTRGEGWGEGSSGISGANQEAKCEDPLPRPLPGYRERVSVSFPSLGLVASGGHTALYAIRSWTDIDLIGATIDDAVGEAYDKVAAILGLGYPGGPIIDRLAATGDPHAVPLPRPLLGRESLDFSFSGLKTAVLYAVRGVPGKDEVPPPLTESRIADVAAAFQSACIGVIVKKLRRGIERTDARSIVIGGGVSANRGLREALKSFDVPVIFPERDYCTDNAAMIGGLGHVLLEAGKTSRLDLDAVTYSQFKRVN